MIAKKLPADFFLSVDEKIQLHLPRLEHAQILFELTDKNRSYLREFLGWLDFSTTVQDTEAFIKQDLVRSLDQEALLMTIWYDKSPVGLVAFHQIDLLNKQASMGYWLDKEHQGKGIMTKSVKTLISYAFHTLKLHRIEIRCAVNNIKSQKIPERLGFQREGLLKDAIWHYKNFFDAYLYALINTSN